MHAGLKAEKRTVSSARGVFQRTYWVRTESAAKQTRVVPTGSLDSRVQFYGGDPAAARRYATGWTDWATHKDSLTYRGAVMAYLRRSRLDVANDARRINSDPSSDGRSAQHMFTGYYGRRAIRTARAMAKVSQDQYSTPWVTVYRGISGAQAAAIRSAANSGNALTVRLDHITSFTTSREVARTFGAGGVVISQRVRRSDIMLSTKAFRGLGFAEAEVVVATRGAMRVQPHQVSTQHWFTGSWS